MKKHTRIILNIVAISLMATGPVLMILPGPQVLSWLGLMLFIYANKDYLKRYKWFRSCEFKLNMWKINRKNNKREKRIWKEFKW